MRVALTASLSLTSGQNVPVGVLDMDRALVVMPGEHHHGLYSKEVRILFDWIRSLTRQDIGG